MAWSAPIDRTRSVFVVLHTPVTSAPNALAICTANVPTPPAAPMINTFCPGFTLSRVAKTLEGGDSGVGNGRRLLEGEVCRLPHELVLSSARVFGEGAVTGTEYLVARLELAHILPDRLNASCDILSSNTVPRSEQPRAQAY